MKRLERYEEKELKEGVTAYVLVTNMPFHRELNGKPKLAAAPFGLGMPDFNRPGMIRVTEAYKQKQKHIDAHVIGESIVNYLRFPVTFDGKLPSESEAIIAVSVEGGNSQLLRHPMSDVELAEYKEYGPAYLGDPSKPSKKLTDRYELFEWLMDAQKEMSREKMLAWFGSYPNKAELEKLSDEELRMVYCG